ncbi:MAG: hypothetical protein ACAH59_07650 [Pseudobdellovibrionaceae bacterium]
MAYEVDPNVKKMRDDFLQSRRNEASQKSQSTLQQGEDAIQRRFAAMGASGSGAQIAAMQKNRDAANEVARQGEADVNSQALQFAEGDTGRSFQGNLSRELADKDINFKKGLADTEQGNKLKELDLAERQFLLDKDTTEFNKRMAEIEASRQPDKGLLGNIPGGLAGGARIALDPVGSLTGSRELGFISNPVGSIAANVIPGGGGK